MDVDSENGVRGSSSGRADRDLVKLVRSLDQTGPGENGEHIERLWNLLTSVPSSPFYAAEESILRWLLKTTKPNSDAAETIRRYPLTWRILGCAFQRIPLFSLAKSLADRKFMAILQQTLKSVAKPTSENEPTAESKKRKRTNTLVFGLQTLKTQEGCLTTGESVLGALRVLLERLDQTTHQSPNDKMGAEHIKALFSQPASEVVTYLAPILSLCDASASHNFGSSESQQVWIETLSSIWNLRLQGQADALEVAMFLSRPGFALLGKLTGYATDTALELDGRIKSLWTQQLETFLHRNLMLPAKSAFANRQDLEIPTRAMDVSRSIAPVAAHVVFHLAATTPRLLAGLSASKIERDWTQEIFKIAEESTRKLESETKYSVLQALLEEALATDSNISVGDLRSVCRKEALASDETNWQLVSLIARCDPDVFLLTEEGARLLDDISNRLQSSRVDSAGSTQAEAIKGFLDAVISGFENARDLSSFLKRWYNHLTICSSESITTPSSRSVWFDSAVRQNSRLIAGIERSLSASQLLDVLQWVDTQDVIQPAANLVFMDTIASSVSSTGVSDAVDLKLFEMAQKVWASKLPSDIQSLRWRITTKTACWADFNGCARIWKVVRSDLSNALQTGALEQPDTFQAFQCATQLWLAFYPDGPASANLTKALVSFSERLSKVIRKAKSDPHHAAWDPRTTQLDHQNWDAVPLQPSAASYVDFSLGISSRLLPMLSRNSDTLPPFLERVLANPDFKESSASQHELASSLDATLSNEDIYHEHAFTGKALDHVIMTLDVESKSCPWTNLRTEAVLKTLVKVPDDLLSRAQRERIMSILLSQRTKISKACKVPMSTWNLVLGLMVKIMRRPTFYPDMSFEDLTALSSNVSSCLLELDIDSAMSLSQLLFELAASTIRQMSGHMEEWGTQYFNKAGGHLTQLLESGVDNVLFLPVLKALVSVMSSANMDNVQALNLKGLQSRLAGLVASYLNIFVRDSKKSKEQTNDKTGVSRLLLSIDAAEVLPDEVLQENFENSKPQVQGLEDAAAQAISQGLVRGWSLRTFLIRRFPGKLQQALPVDFDRLYLPLPEQGVEGSPPDPVSDSNGHEIVEACVDAVNANLSRTPRLMYLQLLVESLEGKSQREGQLVGIHRAIAQMPDNDSNEATSFDLATAHSKLTTFLTKATTAAEFNSTADTLRLLLDQKATSMTQWNIEATMSAISVVSSGSAKVGVDTSQSIFTSLCQLGSAVIRRHRVRLDDHYHILLTTMGSLLRALVLSSSRRPVTASKSGNAPMSSSFNAKKHATAYARLVTLITEPSVASVSRTQHVGALDSAADAAKRTAGRHVYLLLMQYVKLQLEVDVPREVREALEPAVNSIFDVTPPEVRKILNDAMDASGRAILRDMFKRYTQFGKWSGV